MPVTTPTPAAIYPLTGVNMAPARPLKEFAQNGVVRSPTSLAKALKAKYDKYISRDYETFVENCRTGEQIANLQTGKLLLMRSVRTGQYASVKKEGVFSDNKTVAGKFQFYWTKLESEWFSSRPDLDPVIPSDDDQVEEYISDVKIIQDAYSKKFYTIDYERQEFASAAGFGTYISRYRYDPYDKDLKCEILPFPGCRWDIRFIPEESSYFIYQSSAKTAVLEELLGGDLASDDGGEYDYGQELIKRLAHTGGNQVGNGKERPYGNATMNNDENTVIEMWLQPEEYCDIEIEESTKTVSGDTIPAGQSLVKLFPEGMVVIGLNNMNLIWAIHPENHKDHIVTGLYHGQSLCGVGKGISDAVDAMKDLNDLHSQLLTHIKTHAMPGFGYNSSMVTEAMARDIGKARKNIAIDFSQAPDGVHDVNQVIRPLIPQNPAQAAFAYEEKLDNNVQLSMQTTDLSASPVLGVASNTATGDKIRDDNAAAVLVPQHLRKADTRRRGAIVTFNLFKKYIDAPKWFRFHDKNSITAGKYLTGTQFDGINVDFEIVANSQIPQGPYQQKDSLSQLFLQTGGAVGFAQLKQMDPEFAAETAAAFGAKVSVPRQFDIARVERRRVEQAKKLLESELQLQQIMVGVTGQQPDNSNLPAQIVSQLTPPISPKEPYTAQKIAWLAELLDTDEMQYAPPMLRHVVEAIINAHISESVLGAAEVAQDQNMANVMANLPTLLGEQYMSQQAQQMERDYQQQQAAQQQQQQVNQGQAQAQQQLQAASQKAQIDGQQAEAEHQRALAQSDDAHQKALQLKTLDHLAAADQMKQQAKLRPASAK